MKDNCIKTCSDCGEKTDYVGPLWTGRIFDPEFCAKVFEKLKEKSKHVPDVQLEKLLGTICSESVIDAPWYEIGTLASIFHANPPKIDEFVEKLKSAGFRASRTHFSPTGVRTDAKIENVAALIRI